MHVKRMILSLMLCSYAIGAFSSPVYASTPIAEPLIQSIKELDGFISGTFYGVNKRLNLDKGMGQWMFAVGNYQIVIAADQENRRLRVMVPIRNVDPTDSEMLARLLEANFSKTLDARYALTQNVLWAVFLYPLDEWKSNQIKDGVRQVVTLAKNTGTTYRATSSKMIR